MARKAALQDEINEIEARYAAAEALVPPDPPQGPAPDVQVAFLPPTEEEEVDEEMDNEGSDVPGSDVGNFMTPSRKKVIKSPFMKPASLRVTETRSSVFAKAGKLSAQDLVRLSNARLGPKNVKVKVLWRRPRCRPRKTIRH